MSYEAIKMNYDRGLWSKQMVLIAVRKGIISQAQYESIINNEEEPELSLEDVNEVLDIIEGVK